MMPYNVATGGLKRAVSAVAVSPPGVTAAKVDAGEFGGPENAL